MLVVLLFKTEFTHRAFSLSFWQHLDSKWVSSSREIITFRKALLNPITAYQFQRYVSLKGDLLENGVIFWQEVQKYKVQGYQGMETTQFLINCGIYICNGISLG